MMRDFMAEKLEPKVGVMDQESFLCDASYTSQPSVLSQLLCKCPHYPMGCQHRWRQVKSR